MDPLPPFTKSENLYQNLNPGFARHNIQTSAKYSRVQSSELHLFVCNVELFPADGIAEKGGNQCYLPTQFGAVQYSSLSIYSESGGFAFQVGAGGFAL